MQEKSDISSVRRSNFLAVSGYLRRRESATIPQLAEETGLSLPTVTRAINSGITLRIFTSCGICDSDRGRKAVSYAINPDFMHCAIIYFSRTRFILMCLIFASSACLNTNAR